jgi:CHASE3 domain sensor protein
MKLYKGYSLALISNFVYWTITFYSFDKINNFANSITEKKDVNNAYSSLTAKILAIFGGASLTTVLASTIVYPFDTIKKKLQVNGAFGFEHKYSNSRECVLANLKNFRGLYRYKNFELIIIKYKF